MAVTSARTLRLLTLLQSRRHWSGEDLAGRLDVSIRTLRRDVDRLRELGYPVEAHPGVAGGYALMPGASLPPLALDDDEAVAITVGLSAAASTGVAGLSEPSVRALAKIVAVLPARLRRRADALRSMAVPATWSSAARTDDGVEPEALTTVALACRDAERLEFGYAAADGSASGRHVEPARVVPLGRRWYLVAWDLERADWRVFRLDRLTAPRGTGHRFAPRRLPADDAAAYVRERLTSSAWPHRIEAVLEAPASLVRARVTWWLSVEDEPGGRCRVRMDTDDLLWGATALALVGVDFTVISPPGLDTTLREVAARFTAAAAARR